MYLVHAMVFNLYKSMYGCLHICQHTEQIGTLNTRKHYWAVAQKELQTIFSETVGHLN